jgi:uncharacterized protein
MNKIKLALMAAGAWWLWTQVSPYVRVVPRAIPHTDPTQGSAPRPSSQAGDKFFETSFGNINNEWRQLLPSYRAPRLVIFDGQTRAGCTGRADARSPFFCPEDGAIYLGASFRREIPCSGSACDFALAVVLAHEVGHAVQNQLGMLRSRGGPSVELQADCFAGVWASHEDARLKREGKPALVEPGDIEAALRMASAFGGRDHGSGEQRQQSFQRGWQGGALASCTGRAGV